MSPAYDALLKEICVRLGLCGSVVDGEPLYTGLFLPRVGPVSANAFADAVFKAEGWKPDDPSADKYRGSVCEAFVRYMGGAEIEAQLLE